MTNPHQPVRTLFLIDEFIPIGSRAARAMYVGYKAIRSIRNWISALCTVAPDWTPLTQLNSDLSEQKSCPGRSLKDLSNLVMTNSSPWYR